MPSPVNAGDQIGFTVEVKNTGTGPAKGVTLDDPLPAGSGTGVTWAVDNGVGTPSQFVLSGVQGSQTLALCVEHAAGGCGLHDPHHRDDLSDGVRRRTTTRRR